MPDPTKLASHFEAHRARLHAVAYRMLGSNGEADDAVQETWLRLARSDAGAVQNLGGWLTAVISRVCLDQLRVRKQRREDAMGGQLQEQVLARRAGAAGPAREDDGGLAALQLADSVGAALLIVLETLAPAERIAFVLHDLFGVPFDDIAKILERTSAAVRQLASRGRRRVRGADSASPADRERQQLVVRAFLAAVRSRDFAALLAILDPDVVVCADDAATLLGAQPELSGAQPVAEVFVRYGKAAQLARFDGVLGLAWAPRGVPRVILDLAIAGGKIFEVRVIAEAGELASMKVELVGEGS